MTEIGEPDRHRDVQTEPQPILSTSRPSSTGPHEIRQHIASSSPDSSPTPSNPSHPASLNGDEARHGTSPATSVDAPFAPHSGLKLDISPRFAQSRQEQQASLSRAGVARSPHPLDGLQEARSSLTSRTGGILATMQEEVSPSTESRRGSTLGFDANPSFVQVEQAMRASRNRSASSAAALALHSSGVSFVDRWASNAAGRIAPSSGVPSRTIWEDGGVDAAMNGSEANLSSQRPFPPLQRGFSASFVRSRPEPAASPSPFLSSPTGGFHELGFDFSGTSLRTTRAPSSSFQSAPSPFGAASDLPEASSYPDTGVEDLQRPAPGTESRRHSVAGPGPMRESSGVIGGHRRAIGFDVGSSFGQTHSSGQSSANDGGWPRDASQGRDRSVSSTTPGSFNPFAGGSLALSMDDLAGDLDFDPSSRRDGYTDSSEGQRRMPTHRATITAVGANRMASAFDDGFGNIQARSFNFGDSQRTNSGGVDSLSASWDILTPSRMAARSPGAEDPRTFAEMTRQLRQTSIGSNDARAHPHPSGMTSTSIFDTQQEGTRTVRASPGTSPAGVRSASGTGATGHGMSAQAKSFIISQPALSMMQDHLGGPSSAAPGGHAGHGAVAQGQRLGAQVPVLPPFAVPQQLPFGTPMVGLPPPGTVPALSANDLTFSSLAALGPMPPSSMGPPGGLGGGPKLNAVTTGGELQDLGKGLPLSSLARDTPLYIVEFKQGRTDLFFRSTSPSQSPSMRGREAIRRGDLVIVEADRGKDLGTVVNDSITVEQVQAFLAHQSDLTIGAATVGATGVHGGAMGTATNGDEAGSNASGQHGSPTLSMSGAGAYAHAGSNAMGARPMRTINPKRLFTKATHADTSTLLAKAHDEERALQLCISKVMQRGLPMSVVAAEMQWDRRKLTFYYTASMRVDFRDLVKELFRLYKTRIWMCHLGHPSGAGMG